MFRKKLAKKEPPKAEHHVEANAQLKAALDQLETTVMSGIEKLRERSKLTLAEAEKLERVCKGRE